MKERKKSPTFISWTELIALQLMGGGANIDHRPNRTTHLLTNIISRILSETKKILMETLRQSEHIHQPRIKQENQE